ncbi:hypothetical protein GCM10009617_03380 [Leifsonia poae]|uniref:Uncharacterized protein n=1 Tax=Leifsonia poae TaxID=110933 RepID=A0A9W6H6C2_9MICO|nr:hypothetical protein GCM10017584_03380 [Leifsonia poae]
MFSSQTFQQSGEGRCAGHPRTGPKKKGTVREDSAQRSGGMVAAGHAMVAAGQEVVLTEGEMAALEPGGGAEQLYHRHSRISHGVRASE